MRHRPPFHRPRPHWWPENEPWPPHERFRRATFFRRFGCLFAVANFTGLTALVIFIGFLAQQFGLLDPSLSLGQWLVPVGLGVLTFLMLIVAAAVFALRRVLTPMDDLLNAARKVTEGDYSVRVPEKGPRDVRSLAKAFNGMAARLQTTDARRRDLLADVTHELRTPLTVVQGNLEGMIDGVYPADKARLNSILDETQVLSRLVDDLRTLALAESGALQLKREPVDLAILIGETVTGFRSGAEAGGISLEARPDGDIPLLDLDPERIRQVLLNLVSNAMRYTPPGGRIEIRCRADGSAATIEIADNGAGIPAEELPHVFERFYKSRDSGGMGLGLAIAKNLVEAHGGTIAAESRPGQGTTVRIRLPIVE
ncbi:MAG: sensor histidine kinase [Chloroflexota bacterium]